MIILDTCVFDGDEPGSTKGDLLRIIVTSGADTVTVPDIVMHEWASHRVVPQRQKHEKLSEAWRHYATSNPWQVSGKPPALDHDRLVRHWRSRWEGTIATIESSASVMKEALRREAMLLLPCKRADGSDPKSAKIGARDATIWLTAVEYARENPSETVVFVSSNTKDFGDGTSYSYPMDEDVHDLSNFVHLKDFTGLIDRFTTRATVDAAEAEAFLRAPEAREAMMRTAITELIVRQGNERRPFTVTASRTNFSDVESASETDLEKTEARGFSPHHLEIRFGSAKDFKAHKIGNHVWCAATVSWLVNGVAFSQGVAPLTLFPAGAIWEVRVLFSPTQPETPLTVLRAGHLKPASAEEIASMPDFPSVDDTSNSKLVVGWAANGLPVTMPPALLAAIGNLADMQMQIGTRLEDVLQRTLEDRWHHRSEHVLPRDEVVEEPDDPDSDL
ncbi:PIN domain-containing protein [Streptomyces sp. GZWMJZ-114]|uniref:PIN domain-containing protein n=1 Tax=Streptomyces sp. GZWMJZ-114 TaxID=2494734 RepID=UPI001013175B|nr:PIN domain-containing protein [Streptomyces sp. GZWMJZ-114]